MRKIPVTLALVVILSACGSAAEVARSLEESNNERNRSYAEQLAEDSDRVEVDEDGNMQWSALENDELAASMAYSCDRYDEFVAEHNKAEQNTA